MNLWRSIDTRISQTQLSFMRFQGKNFLSRTLEIGMRFSFSLYLFLFVACINSSLACLSRSDIDDHYLQIIRKSKKYRHRLVKTTFRAVLIGSISATEQLLAPVYKCNKVLNVAFTALYWIIGRIFVPRNHDRFAQVLTLGRGALLICRLLGLSIAERVLLCVPYFTAANLLFTEATRSYPVIIYH